MLKHIKRLTYYITTLIHHIKKITHMVMENSADKEISAYKEVYTKYNDFDTPYKENHTYKEISAYKEVYT